MWTMFGAVREPDSRQSVQLDEAARRPPLPINVFRRILRIFSANNLKWLIRSVSFESSASRGTSSRSVSSLEWTGKMRQIAQEASRPSFKL
jgi:hypothetical protein